MRVANDVRALARIAKDAKLGKNEIWITLYRIVATKKTTHAEVWFSAPLAHLLRCDIGLVQESKKAALQYLKQLSDLGIDIDKVADFRVMVREGGVQYEDAPQKKNPAGP